MKIEAITLREIQIPLVHFFETSFGRTYRRRILLVTLHCEGINAWGECVAGEDPFYSSEWIESAWLTLTRYLAPALVGRSVRQGSEAGALMSHVRGHRMAKAALENALWDAEAQARKMPLWKLLGARAGRSHAVFPLASRTHIRNCSTRSRPNSPPAIAASSSR